MRNLGLQKGNRNPPKQQNKARHAVSMSPHQVDNLLDACCGAKEKAQDRAALRVEYKEVKFLRRVSPADVLCCRILQHVFCVICLYTCFIHCCCSSDPSPLQGMQGSKCVISTVGKPDYLETANQMYILMPFMNGGELNDLYNKCLKTSGCVCSTGLCWEALGPPYSKAFVLALFYQVARHVQHLRSTCGVSYDIYTHVTYVKRIQMYSNVFMI